MSLRFLKNTLLTIGAVVGLGLGAGSAHAQPVLNILNATDDLRTGGCTGCVNAQMRAAVNTFHTITESYRGCNTDSSATGSGNGITPDSSNCAVGAPNAGDTGRLADFFVIQGFVRDVDFANNQGVGVACPGDVGHPDSRCDSLGQVTYRVSGNGSGNGINCARSSPAPIGIGFLAPEGFDGIGGNADDAAGAGTNAGLVNMSRAPLVASCDNDLDVFVETTMTIDTVLPALADQSCIVQYDLGPATGTFPGTHDGVIRNDQAGLVPAPTNTAINTTDARGESSNLRAECSTGFSDLAPSDFDPQRPAFAGGLAPFGAQIFKIIASDDVAQIGAPDAKLHLGDPQVENLFGEPANNSVCSVAHLGGDASSANDRVRACIRVAGSGTRETFRLTYMANTGGNKVQSEDSTGGSGQTTSCPQVNESGGLIIPAPQKIVDVNPGTGDVVNCVETGGGGGFGYVDAGDFAAGVHSVVLEGVDPDAHTPAQLKEEVRCGRYRFWGPLAGGLGPYDEAANEIFRTAHQNALRDKDPHAGNRSYLPASDVSFNKNTVDGPYNIQFRPTADVCSGAAVTPVAISANPTAGP